MKLKEVVELGRRMRAFGGGKRGGRIELRGDVAYLVNSKGSAVYKVFNDQTERFGEGCFYAGDYEWGDYAEDRGEYVAFVLERGGVKTRHLVKAEAPFSDKAEEAFKKFFFKPNLLLPSAALEVMDPDILITTFTVSGDRLSVSQIRSDGATRKEHELRLSVSLDEARVSFFTKDLYALKGFAQKIMLGVMTGKPIPIVARVRGGWLKGVISHIIWEV